MQISWKTMKIAKIRNRTCLTFPIIHLEGNHFCRRLTAKDNTKNEQRQKELTDQINQSKRRQIQR